MTPERAHAEAVRLVYSTCRHHGLQLPPTWRQLSSFLVDLAAALPPSREGRAEACLLVAADLRWRHPQ